MSMEGSKDTSSKGTNCSVDTQNHAVYVFVSRSPVALGDASLSVGHGKGARSPA